jgi:hypothetical protein
MKYLSMPFTFSTDDSVTARASTLSEKTPSSENTWNVNHDDFNRSVFTTVYTSDLEAIIEGLKNGRMHAGNAAAKLEKLSKNLDEPQVIRRPIPNTLPSDKKMYMGLLALAVLGSVPSGMTASDSEIMNLPSPVANTDRLLISKRRLISVLFRLGLLESPTDKSNGIDQIILIINLLWEEARLENNDLSLEEEHKSLDYEVQNGDEEDLIELGVLKLTLFAVAYKQPSWFRKYCMPCNSTPATVSKSKMTRTGGELVKHDVAQCPICANALGCPKHSQEDDDSPYDEPEKHYNNNRAKSGVRVLESPNTPKRGESEGDIELRIVRGVHTRKSVTRSQQNRRK